MIAQPGLFESDAKPVAKPANGLTLRPYQAEAVEAIFENLATHPSTLLVLPTGCGKTCIASKCAQIVQQRVLFIAHREELIHQAANTMHRMIGVRPEIEMGGFYASPQARIVVASKDSLHPKRLERFDPSEFGLIITDEAHHAVADSYRRIYDYFGNVPHVGVTATPDRTDEAALGQVFGSVAYVYEIDNAIDDGWLVPIRQQSVEIDGLDLSKVGTVAGDLNARQLAEELEVPDTLLKMAAATIDLSRGRKTLIFTPRVHHAEKLCAILNSQMPDSARWVSGKTDADERRQTLADYHHGRFQFLCNVGVFTEGFDEPGVEVIALMRPTKSRSLFAQMVGRGTRTLPGTVDGLDTAEQRRQAIADSAKPWIEIIDFEGNCGHHKLVTVADILGGNRDDAVIERAAQLAKAEGKAGKPADVMAKLDEAEEQIHDEREQRRKAEEKRLAGVKMKARYRTQSIDPFDVLDMTPPRQRGWDAGRRPTDKMLSAIQRMTGGKVQTQEMSFSEARTLINKLISRREHGWCTFSQAALLKKYGYDPKGIRFEEAKTIIDGIKANGWKRPDGPALTMDQIESY